MAGEILFSNENKYKTHYKKINIFYCLNKLNRKENA